MALFNEKVDCNDEEVWWGVGGLEKDRTRQ